MLKRIGSICIIRSQMEHTCIKYSIEGKQGCRYACKKFTCHDVNLWKQLYISIFMPHLEFTASVWNPFGKADISILKVQWRASKIPTRLNYFTNLLLVHSLEKQRVYRNAWRGKNIHRRLVTSFVILLSSGMSFSSTG